MSTMNRMYWCGVASVTAIAGAVACSSSSPPTYPSGTAPADGGSAVDAAGGGATLTVMNFLSWCSVSINGGAASTNPSIMASIVAGGTATIVATPASSSFQIGADPWFGVGQNNGGAAPGMDNGTGASETSTATVVITGNQCVSVCCQPPNNTPTPRPTTNSVPVRQVLSSPHEGDVWRGQRRTRRAARFER